MLSLLAGFGTCSSLVCFLRILYLFELIFVLFELSFEAKVGTYDGPYFSDKGDGLFKIPVIDFHEIREYQC